MGWLIVGLVLALLGGLAVLTRWGSRRPVGDDTLVAELLGPSAVRGLPAPPVRQEVKPPPRPRSPPGKATGWKPSWRRLGHGRRGCTNRSPPRQPTRSWRQRGNPEPARRKTCPR